MDFTLQDQPTKTFQIKIGGIQFTTAMFNGTGQASQWYIEHSNPSPIIGRNSDCFLNIDTGEVFRKEGGVWVSKGFIQGTGGGSTLANVLAAGNDGGGLEILNIGNPTAVLSATNKLYVDAQISSAIASEASARTAADLSEATARTNADAALQLAVNSLSSQNANQTNQINSLISDLANEISNRSSSDNNLQEQIAVLDEWARNNSGNIHTHLIAGEALPIGTVGYIDETQFVFKFQTTDPGIAYRPMGLVAKDYGSGEEIELYHAGLVQFDQGILSAGSIYYASGTGAISLSPSRWIVGIAITDQLFMMRLQDLNYSSLQGIPATFPPSVHTHVKAEISDAGDAWIDRRGGNYYRRSQRWYLPSDNASTLSGVNHTTPSVFFAPMVVEKTITIDAIAVEVTTAGIAGSFCRFGIYNGNASTCEPTTLIVDSGDVAASTTGVKTFVLGTPITLQPGLYFTALSTGSSTQHQFRSMAVSSFATVIGQASAGGANQGSYINGTRAAYGALPANASSLLTLTATQGQIYGLWYRIQ